MKDLQKMGDWELVAYRNKLLEQERSGRPSEEVRAELKRVAAEQCRRLDEKARLLAHAEESLIDILRGLD